MSADRLSNIVSNSRIPVRFATSFLVVAVGLGCAAVSSAEGSYRDASVLTCMAVGIAAALATAATVETILLGWFVTTPFASFLIRYPLDRSILTFNRLVFGFLIAVALLEPFGLSITVERSRTFTTRIRHAVSASKFEIAWGLLALLAIASAASKSNNFSYAVRIAVDSFWLPLFAFYFARNYMDLKRAGRVLLLSCIVLAFFLFLSGAFELATGVDLFQFKGGELVREGERRVSGPFASDISYAIICLLLFLFLKMAPSILKVSWDRGGRMIYRCALVATGVGALLSLFRMVGFALAVCWILERWASRHEISVQSAKAVASRILPRTALAMLVLAVVGVSLAVFARSVVGGRLTDPRTVFGRLATWQAGAKIAVDNPIFGVGLTNYGDYFQESHYDSDLPAEEIQETKAQDSPHSNLLWIASELGGTGLFLYILANVYLVLMGLRALRRSAEKRQQLTAVCFLVLIVAYWLPGFTLQSAYYSDQNLCFFFLLGILSTQFSNGRLHPDDSNSALKNED
jgi:O-antigen ligase